MNDESQFNSPLVKPLHRTPRLSDAQERQLMEFVDGIVRRARLWRNEQNEVRLELLDHFDDGIAAGRSVEQLLQDFGSPQVAARLIRAAKIRNRPWSWHVMRRALQVCVVSLCIVFGTFSFLIARLHLAALSPPTDDIGQLDSATIKIAESDRGWPDYREGLMHLAHNPRQMSESQDQIRAALNAGPADPYWDLAVRHLDANRVALDLFVKGAAHPRLGYVYRDSANDPWLRQGKSRSSSEIYPRNTPIVQVLLPQYQELGFVRQLLYEAALRALHERNQLEFHRYWQAQCQLATQILAESDFIIAQAIGRATAANAMALLRRWVTEHPEMISDEQLQAYRQDLMAADWEWQGSTTDEYRRFADVFLNVVYSQDAMGNGRVTAAGCVTLRNTYLANNSPDDQLVWTALLPEFKAAGMPHQSGTPSRPPAPNVDAINQELLALRWSLTLADRRDMRSKIDSLLDTLRTELDQPLTQNKANAESPYVAELRRLATTPSLLRRYWPILMVLPSRRQAYWPEVARERQTMSREATVTVIALEQYRRRIGHWPERLEQLVPGDLPRIPQDVFSGRSLVYRLVKGKPLLYSVWEDSDDDGGSPIPPETTAAGPHNGDFRFVPAQ